jgi:hypothetical protein
VKNETVIFGVDISVAATINPVNTERLRVIFKLFEQVKNGKF